MRAEHKFETWKNILGEEIIVLRVECNVIFVDVLV